MSLRSYLSALRRRWLLLAICLIATVGGAALVTFLATPQYASTTSLFISNSQAGTSEAVQVNQLTASRIASYADLATSTELGERVVADLGLDDDPDDLATHVEAEPLADTVLLDLTFTDEDAAYAQRLSQAYAGALVEMIGELETPVSTAEAPIRASIVGAASDPGDPVSPRPVRNIGLGVLLGLILGLGLVVLRELTDTTLKSSEDLTKLTELPVLGTIPSAEGAKSRPIVSDLGQHLPRAEAFRILRTNLQFVDIDSDDKLYLVTSPLPQDGKTSTSVNLAVTLAKAGRKALLVEADLRRPRASAALGLDRSVGLTTALLGKVSLEDAIQSDSTYGIDVLASGPLPPNPAELLQTRAMTTLLGQLRELYDVVIIDAPPLLPVTDAALIASAVDGTLLVVRHGKTRTEHLEASLAALDVVGVQASGIIFNDVPKRGLGQSGYGYGYGYGYTSDLTRQKPAGGASKA